MNCIDEQRAEREAKKARKTVFSEVFVGISVQHSVTEHDVHMAARFGRPLRQKRTGAIVKFYPLDQLRHRVKLGPRLLSAWQRSQMRGKPAAWWLGRWHRV